MTFFRDCKCPKMQFRAHLHVVQCVPSLILAKIMHVIMLYLIESDTSLLVKKENPKESFSRQNCIFGGFYPGRCHSILSSQKALALRVLMHLERDG